jgi:hypothetical protein
MGRTEPGQRRAPSEGDALRRVAPVESTRRRDSLSTQSTSEPDVVNGIRELSEFIAAGRSVWELLGAARGGGGERPEGCVQP